MKILKRIKLNLTLQWFEDFFGADFFHDFPELQKRYSKRLFELIEEVK